MTWSAVDRSPEPERLVDYLDSAARGLAGMKHYVVATHARFHQGPTLDLGCGAGHDLALLDAAGLAPIGLDPSATLVTVCRTRGVAAPLVRAIGEALPLRDASIAGCRIDRVLQHVAEPARVIAEVARCLRPGGIVTVFEPDWTTLSMASDLVAPSIGWLYAVASPDAGATAAPLLQAVGFEVLDIVSERSFKTSLADYERVLPLAPSAARAVREGQIDAETASLWQREQEQRDRDGRFAAGYTKILTVAAAPTS